MEISIGKYNESVLVGLIYRHPGNSINDFTKQLSEFLLVNNILQNKEVCIFWDININSLKKDTETSFKNNVVLAHLVLTSQNQTLVCLIKMYISSTLIMYFFVHDNKSLTNKKSHYMFG